MVLHLGEKASVIAQLVKNPPAMQETLVQFLGQEDSLEKGMATYSSIQAWRIHGLYSPSNSSGQNTGVGSLSLLQGIFPIQELNQSLLHCRRSLPAELSGKPSTLY